MIRTATAFRDTFVDGFTAMLGGQSQRAIVPIA